MNIPSDGRQSVMGKVDLTIIRLAVYEMKYDDDDSGAADSH